MIAEDIEENNVGSTPSMSIKPGSTLEIIIESYKNAVIPFKSALTNPKIKWPLNENKLTQIFVEQIDCQLRKYEISFGIKNQYSDIFLGSKGIPDFYFHKLEEGSVNEPLLVVEAKILPAPLPATRQKEYVIGLKKNGGIERFKLEKHGLGLEFGGIIAFIIDGCPNIWNTTINQWIINLTLVTPPKGWKNTEVLRPICITTNYSFLESVAHRISGNDISLHHFWVNI